MKRILLIEDEEEVRRLLKVSLQRAGYEILDAPDGRIVSRLGQMDHIDLVITDIFMPEKEGIETIRELKRGFPDIKIIAMSGGGNCVPSGMGLREYLDIAKKLGVDRTFEKPFELPQMLLAVKELTD